MSLDVDEDEHSIEMHLPYVAKVMQRCVCANYNRELVSSGFFVVIRVPSLLYLFLLVHSMLTGRKSMEPRLASIFSIQIISLSSLLISATGVHDVRIENSDSVTMWLLGKRFKFTHYDKSYKHIYQSIEALDRQVYL